MRRYNPAREWLGTDYKSLGEFRPSEDYSDSPYYLLVGMQVEDRNKVVGWFYRVYFHDRLGSNEDVEVASDFKLTSNTQAKELAIKKMEEHKACSGGPLGKPTEAS